MSPLLETDVVIIGGTPGGIAAALAAARCGQRVVLAESSARIGGMSTSGLGKSDVEQRHLIGGLFREFTQRVERYYQNQSGDPSDDVRLCQEGYYFEPSVAERVFAEMLAEQPQIRVLTEHRLASAAAIANSVSEATVVWRSSGEVLRLQGRVFIDATYEGDLLAAAGAEFRLGRESRADFDEPHAGVVYFDYRRQQFLPGTTGEGDDRLPAYTYRLCLTTDPENAFRLTSAPADYDRRIYAGYLEDLAAGRLAGPANFKPGRGFEPAHFNTAVRALSITPLPGRKTDVNMNPRPLAFPFAEENRDYLLSDDAGRQRINSRIRDLTLGLLWFLQNDDQIPPAQRALANQYHLPLDEFPENGHFPSQLYIREGRRLIGDFTLTERHITLQTDDVDFDLTHADAVAVGEFPIDSFPCRKRQPGDEVVLEGYLGMLDHITRPYEIPYRIMLPRTVEGLLVPVAASTTHVAFSSIRMEPTWMALGQAAGIAADLAIRRGVLLREIPIAELQQRLAAAGQIFQHLPTSTN